MLDYNVLDKINTNSNYCKIAKNGMVSTSNYLASQAGLEILKNGGNAVDAAIATAAVLTVVEPMSNGVGSDSFAIVYFNNNIYGLNASGKAAKNISAEKLKALGYSNMPTSGWIPVMVPGTPKAWAELNKRFGKLSLIEDLKPAIFYAKNGFPVSPANSYLWNKYIKKHREEYKGEEFNEWFKVFTKDKKPYKFGEIFKNVGLSKSLKIIGETYSKAFYEGEIAEQFIKESNLYGGYFSKEDLSSYDVEWINPISINYKGYDILEMPPNGQGLIALMALNILKNFDNKKIDDIQRYHLEFESMKLAFSDGLNNNYEYYLKDEYGKRRSNEISNNSSVFEPLNINKSGTVYLCTADNEGNMVSYIQSNYQDFGSGIVLKDLGISLQNRGCDFSLNEKDNNYLKPNIRSYHTIMPGFIMKDNKAVGPFGVMGGYMQPQGHVQIVRRLIDDLYNPQSAIDAFRWQWMKDGTFIVEPEFPDEIIESLRRKGHIIRKADNRFSFGRSQIILRYKDNMLVGGCDSRTDSAISCY